MAARCSADAMVRVGGFKLRGVKCSQSWDGHGICVSTSGLSHFGAILLLVMSPALAHRYLPSMSRLMEMAAALCVWSREVTPGGGTWPQPEKTMCRRQTRPCSHPPSSPRATESRSPGVQMEKCSQSFTGKQRNPNVCSLPTRKRRT